MPSRRFSRVPQAKLVVRPPGDKYEREADRIAQAVTRGAPGPGHVQAIGGASGFATPRADVRPGIRGAAAGGQRIPGHVRAPLEQALDADFSGVRVHADAGADRLSRSLRASALTTGQDIFFRRGTYAPGSGEGYALLAHELVHVIQQRSGQPGTAGAVQLNRPEKYDTYDEARDENKYSRVLLRLQADDPLEDHIGKAFTADQRDNIYRVNKGKGNQITSDISEEPKPLFFQNTSKTPHVDHRYPKSQSGSNSYSNAQVIPARVNLAKSDKRHLATEPDEPLPPYAHLKDPKNVSKGAEFSKEQKDAIYAANKRYYKVKSIVSDHDGKTRLAKYDSSQVPHIDHITPKSAGGSNYYFNARVISAEENIQKGGERGGTRGEDDYPYEEQRLTLRQFIDYKRTDKYPMTVMDVPTSPTREEEEAESRSKKKRRHSEGDAAQKRQRTQPAVSPPRPQTPRPAARKKKRKSRRRN